MTLKSVARKVLPAGARHFLYHSGAWNWKENIRLARLYSRISPKPPGSWIDFEGLTVRINDAQNFFILCKDLFVHHVYRFESKRPDPRILDCGGNIGMSVLYFKHLYPSARITTFEPDPAIFPYLKDNIARNRLQYVGVVNAAVSGKEGTLAFFSDALYSSCLADLTQSPPPGWTRYEVPCVRLSPYLNEQVDLLKMNIEGAECEVITECAGRLRQIREIIIEYHHLPGLERNLHRILTILNDQGFEYLINDLDPQTNPGSEPPFRLNKDSRYFLLIYARRLD